MVSSSASSFWNIEDRRQQASTACSEIQLYQRPVIARKRSCIRSHAIDISHFAYYAPYSRDSCPEAFGRTLLRSERVPLIGAEARITVYACTYAYARLSLAGRPQVRRRAIGSSGANYVNENGERIASVQ